MVTPKSIIFLFIDTLNWWNEWCRCYLWNLSKRWPPWVYLSSIPITNSTEPIYIFNCTFWFYACIKWPLMSVNVWWNFEHFFLLLQDFSARFHRNASSYATEITELIVELFHISIQAPCRLSLIRRILQHGAIYLCLHRSWLQGTNWSSLWCLFLSLVISLSFRPFFVL